MRTLSGWVASFLAIIFCGAGLLLANSGINNPGANMDDKDGPQDRKALWQNQLYLT